MTTTPDYYCRLSDLDYYCEYPNCAKLADYVPDGDWDYKVLYQCLCETHYVEIFPEVEDDFNS